MEIPLEVGIRVEAVHRGVRLVGTVEAITLQRILTGYVPVVKVKVVEPTVDVIETPAHIWRPVGSTAEHLCGSCGRPHVAENPLVTPEIIDLYSKFKEANPELRREILTDIARIFVNTLDDTDFEAPEWAHDLCGGVRDADRMLEDAEMALGRQVLTMLAAEEQEGQHTITHHILAVKRRENDDEDESSKLN